MSASAGSTASGSGSYGFDHHESVTVPGKVFLMGEYAILEGLPAIVAAIKPEHVYCHQPYAQTTPHADSPLGRFIQELGSNPLGGVLEPWYGSIPVENYLGLGSSTAELIAHWRYGQVQGLSSHQVPATESALISWYRHQFPKQSGADLAVQLKSQREGLGIYEVKPENATLSASKLTVGRVTSQLLVLKAPNVQKLKTHEALKEHSKVEFDTFKCEFLHEKFKKLIVDDEMNRDWRVLSEWADELKRFGLESPFAGEVREAIQSVRGVYGAKGCGAGLNDLFLLAVDPAFDREALDAVCAKFDLKFLGSLRDLTQAGQSIRAFAPVNIAWIKYMGKEKTDKGLAPSNSSLSLTLDQVGTLTEIEVRDAFGAPQSVTANTPAAGRYYLHWNELGYVPPEAGREKIERWMRDERIWDPALNELGFRTHPPAGDVWITSFNSAPAGTGIATSASAFAAMTLAWAAWLVGEHQRGSLLEKFADPSQVGAKTRAVLAGIASRGSGSAGRSMDGPWVEWTSDNQFYTHGFDSDWVDCILLLDTEPKKVSSSQAHERVKTSTMFADRMKRLPKRFSDLKQAMTDKNIGLVRQHVLEEAVEMHDLFHTSQPAFTYLNEAAKKWIALAKNPDPAFPSKDFVITLDAGANVHWFVRPKELKLWRTWFKFKEPKLNWIEGKVGLGARYV